MATSSIFLALPVTAQEEDAAGAAEAGPDAGCAGVLPGDDEHVAGRGGRDGPADLAGRGSRDGPIEIAGRGGRDGPSEAAPVDAGSAEVEIAAKPEADGDTALEVAARGSGGGAAAFDVAGRGTSGGGAPTETMLTAHNVELGAPSSAADFGVDGVNPCAEGRGSNTP